MRYSQTSLLLPFRFTLTPSCLFFMLARKKVNLNIGTKMLRYIKQRYKRSINLVSTGLTCNWTACQVTQKPNQNHTFRYSLKPQHLSVQPVVLGHCVQIVLIQSMYRSDGIAFGSVTLDPFGKCWRIRGIRKLQVLLEKAFHHFMLQTFLQRQSLDWTAALIYCRYTVWTCEVEKTARNGQGPNVRPDFDFALSCFLLLRLSYR